MPASPKSSLLLLGTWCGIKEGAGGREKGEGGRKEGGTRERERMHAGNDKCKSAWLGVASPQNVIFILHRHCVLQLCAE